MICSEMFGSGQGQARKDTRDAIIFVVEVGDLSP